LGTVSHHTHLNTPGSARQLKGAGVHTAIF